MLFSKLKALTFFYEICRILKSLKFQEKSKMCDVRFCSSYKGNNIKDFKKWQEK